MTSPPSRTELEKALRARRARRPTAQARDAHPSAELHAPGRRATKILGGDPRGVKSKSVRHYFWSKLRSFGIVNTVASTLVLLILAAFFWPSDPKGVQEVAVAAPSAEPLAIYTESRADEIPELNEGVADSFVRETDIPRADEFREQDYIETRSKELLELAETQLTAGNYTLPAGNNAAETYREVLELNSNNVDAQRGIEYIAGRFLSTGTTAAEQGNFTAARASLERLAELDKDAPAYTQLNQIIEDAERAAEISSLLERANKAFEAENYILPAQNNAWSLFKQVLVLDAENTTASTGVARIADVYIGLANTAAISGEYEAAAGYLATVGVIDPENPSLEIVEQIISTARPLADRARVSQAKERSSEKDEQPTTDAASTTEPVAAELEASSTDSQVAPIDTASAESTSLDTTAVSQSRTPEQEAAEQAAFDRQYLDRGLAAYYQGDYATAAALLKPLADKGISRAQFRIAYMHYLGRGFTQNRSEADRIIRAALPAIQGFASDGRAWAQSDLGSLYEDGLVLPRDYKEAFFWYRAAAEQGYAGAQTNLGVLYAQGLGVPTSRSTAIEWFEKAAAQGDAAAARNLAALGAQ